jgi:hypothetical protein
MIGKPDYTVELITNADVGVLLSKDRFEWAGETELLAHGTRLIFRLRSGHLQGQTPRKVVCQ